MASFSGKDIEKAKLQWELKYYASLISKHEKLQPSSNTIFVKDNKQKVFERPSQISLQAGNFSGGHKSPAACTFKPKNLRSHANPYRRTVVQNEIANPIPNQSYLYPKRLVVSTPIEKKRNLLLPASMNKVNSIQQRTVLYNTKKCVPNVSTRSVLLPEVSSKSINGSLSKPHINHTTKSNELGKLLAETQKISMKARSNKHIEELKALIKQLEQRNKKLALVKSRIASLSLKNCDELVNPIVSDTSKLLFKKTNLDCQIKPELILKSNAGCFVKNNPLSKNKVPMISSLESKSVLKNDESTLSLRTINVETPVACSVIGHKNLGNELNLPSRERTEVQGCDTSLQLMKNQELFHSNCASIRLNTSKTNKSELPALSNLKTPNNSPLTKAKYVLGSKLSITSKQVSKLSGESLMKLVNIRKPLTNIVSTSSVKKMITQKPISAKKRGNMTKLISSKYKVINKRISPSVSSKNRLSEESITKAKHLERCKETSTKVAKPLKNVQSSIASTPLAINLKGQKVNTMKKQGNMAKLVASKYKVVNKKIPNSQEVLNKNKFSKIRPEAASNSFSKWNLHATRKTPPSIKRLNSNYIGINLLKTPKRLNNSLLKSPSPKFMKKGKYVLKRRKLLDTTIPAYTQRLKNNEHPILLKPQFKHTKVNNLVGSHSKKSTKFKLNMKSSSCSPLKSKYKVINRRGSSKKSVKSSSPKPSAVLRTKSGVDIDLLIELAAEKESAENENRADTLKKESVLSKRVYKSKNAIVNKNVCSVTRAKMARMIKAKYLLNKNVWTKQITSRKFLGNKYYKGHRRFVTSLQRTPMSQFCNSKLRRNYFQFSGQRHKNKLLRSYEASSQYVKTNKRIFTYRNEHLRTLQNQVNSTPISKVLANRVLHQSINRVITASAKKKLSKVNTYCMFYNRFGRCNKGLKCTYVHDPSKIAVCTRFLRGTCKNDNCLFSHEISPGKMAICSFFLLGSCTKTDCPYRHENLSPNTELCKAFVQGYCPDGKQCKKAHVLVCPHFIQGCCEKGDTCPFPHPPPKEKKVLLKPIEKRETLMEVEDLMEKVSRYFQPSNEQSIVLAANKTTVVPKRQKLPEQPSFIAL